MKAMQAILLSACLWLGGLAMSAWAQSGTCGDNLTWTLEDGTLTISGTGEMDDYDHLIDVPWYEYKENIRTVVTEDAVASIGKSAFWECANLAEVTIGEGIASIGSSSFFDCPNL